MNKSNKDESIYVFRIGNLGDSLVIIPALKAMYNCFNKKMILLTNDEPKYIKAWDVLKYTGVFKYYLEYKCCDIKNLYCFVRKIRRDKNRKILFYFHPGRNYIQALRDYIFFKFCGFYKVYGIFDSINIWKDTKNSNKMILKKESDRYLKMVNKFFGLNIGEKDIQYPLMAIPDDIKNKTNNILEKENLKDKFLIAIGFGSKMPSKRWGIDKYSELMNKILQVNSKITFILFGDENEFLEGERLKEKVFGKVLNMAGRLSIIEAACLLLGCKILISNDTGTMHLGAIMGVPCIALFSARDNPGKWEPYGKNNLIVRKKIDCERCFLVRCPRGNECLNRISVEEVYEQVYNKYLRMPQKRFMYKWIKKELH